MRLFIQRCAAAVVGAVLAVAGLSAPALATGGSAKPCTAYLYYGTTTNLCADHPGSGDVNCDQVKWKVKLVGSWDPWGLDGRGQHKGDGKGCESKPTCPEPSATVTTKPTTSPTTAPTTHPTTQPTTQPTTTAPTTSPPVSPPPSTTRPPTTSPTATASQSAEPGPALPLTGPSGPVIGGVAVLLLAAGVGMLVLVRRRRTKFVA